MRMLNDLEKKFIDISKKILADLRETQPLIHVISNVVTLESVADVVLATGAVPVAAYAPEEVEEVTSRAQSLLLNTGTPTAERRRSYILAGRSAKTKGIPVILDPVGVGISRFRIEIIDEIMREVRPDVIRMNVGEASFLVKRDSSRLRGVDAIDDSLDENELKEFSANSGAVLVITGEENIVTDGKNFFKTNLGNPLMKYETGAGCMLDGVIASFLAHERFSIFERVSAALTLFNYLSMVSERSNLKRSLIHAIKRYEA